MSLMPDFERDLVTVGEGWHSTPARLRRSARRGAVGGTVAAVLVVAIGLVFSLVGTPEREVPTKLPTLAVDRLLTELAPDAQPAKLSATDRASYRQTGRGLGLDPGRAVTIRAPAGASAKRWLVVPGRRGFCVTEGARGGPGSCGPYQHFYEGGRVPTFSGGDGTITFSAVAADGFRRIAAIEKRTGKVGATAPIVDNAGQLRLPNNPDVLNRYRILVQRTAPATPATPDPETGLTGAPARLYELPRSWRQTDTGPAAIEPGGATTSTTVTSWPYEQDANGPANSMPKNGMIIELSLRRPGCSGVKRLTSYPALKSPPNLRLPPTTAFSLEGAADVPQYRLQRRAQDYYVDIRVSVNNPNPRRALVNQAQRALERVDFPDWPDHC